MTKPEHKIADGGASAANPRVRYLLAFVLLLVSVALCNALLTLVFVPYGSKSELAWTDYAKEDKIDCVVVGTSTSMRNIGPRILDEQLDVKSFNFATPSQMLDESYVAVRTVAEDHDIKRVILGLSHSQLLRSAKPNPGSPFMYERSRVVNLQQQLEGVGYLMFNSGAISEPASLNMLFPWVSGMVSKSPAAIVENAQMKLDGTSLYDAAKANEPGVTYCGKGFSGKTKKLNYNGSEATSYFAQQRRDDVGVNSGKANSIDPSRKRVLIDLCDYCQEHGIELIAVAPPLASFNIIEYGSDYFELGHEVHDLVESHGGRYFDINLARSELFDPKESYFSDAEHLNFDGATAFTSSLCELVAAVDKGEDVTELFMAGEDEYLASVDRISCVFAETSASKNGVEITARALAGSEIEVEYQFCLREGDSWVAVRGWSTDPVATLKPVDGIRGPFKVRVNTRQVGNKDVERYRELWAMY